MNLLSLFPTVLTIILLWVSLASNIIMLMWITINGNAAKRMEGILSRQAETNRHNSELAKELLKEMSGLSRDNITLRRVIEQQSAVEHDHLIKVRNQASEIEMLWEQKERYAKIITDNGWETNMG